MLRWYFLHKGLTLTFIPLIGFDLNSNLDKFQISNLVFQKLIHNLNTCPCSLNYLSIICLDVYQVYSQGLLNYLNFIWVQKLRFLTKFDKGF